MTPEDIIFLESLVEKFERPVQVYLEFQNLERAEQLRKIIVKLSTVSTDETHV